MKSGAYPAACFDGERNAQKEIGGQFEAQIHGHVLAKFRVSRGLERRLAAAPSLVTVARSGPEKILPNGRSRFLVGITHHGNAISERDEAVGKEARQESARRDLLGRS